MWTRAGHVPVCIDHVFSPKVLQGRRCVAHIDDSPIAVQRLPIAPSIPPVWPMLCLYISREERACNTYTLFPPTQHTRARPTYCRDNLERTRPTLETQNVASGQQRRPASIPSALFCVVCLTFYVGFREPRSSATYPNPPRHRNHAYLHAPRRGTVEAPALLYCGDKRRHIKGC